MAHKTASVIVLVVLISLAGAQLEKKTTTTTTTTTTETPVDPTTEAPVTTTTPSTTTPSTTTPTTTAPTTTTPSTTTPTTTTPSTTTPTTTAATTTSTVAPTTVAPTPTPVPSPEYKKWWYTDPATNETCVIVQLAVQLNLTYVNVDDKPLNVLYNVPVNKTGEMATGSCGKDKQSITVQWGQMSQMMLQFTVNNSQFMLSEIYLSINATDVFADAKANQTMELFHINNEYPTSVSMSYHCNEIKTIGFTNTTASKDVVVNATISHVQLEAFRSQNTNQFSTARDCEAIDTPDIVPIAVGCALAGLVVVVLIAYLVGRRRQHARGYLSM